MALAFLALHPADATVRNFGKPAMNLISVIRPTIHGAHVARDRCIAMHVTYRPIIPRIMSCIDWPFWSLIMPDIPPPIIPCMFCIMPIIDVH